MYNNTTRDATLTGMALCEVKLADRLGTVFVITHITVPCTYTPDWQCDAHCWHDEGNFNYDYDDAFVTYPDEYEEIKLYNFKNHIEEGNSAIIKLINVLDAWLSEKDS